jgi:hypothetical protein
MARLVRKAKQKVRVDAELTALIVEAVDAGENQGEIARIVGRSKEYVRLVRNRAHEGE